MLRNDCPICSNQQAKAREDVFCQCGNSHEYVFLTFDDSGKFTEHKSFSNLDDLDTWRYAYSFPDENDTGVFERRGKCD